MAKTIFEILPEGEANALKSSDLVRLIGCDSPRELRSMIAKERESGLLILSTCRNGGGYFRPSQGEAGQREIAAFIATLHSRAINTLKALKAARAALNVVDGQLFLEECEEAG